MANTAKLLICNRGDRRRPTRWSLGREDRRIDRWGAGEKNRTDAPLAMVAVLWTRDGNNVSLFIYYTHYPYELGDTRRGMENVELI